MYRLRDLLWSSLLVLVVIGLFTGCATPAPAQTGESDPQAVQVAPSEGQKTSPPDRLEIVYFHRANPCHCMAVVEGYIKQVIYLDFASEEASGKIVYRSVVSDDPANKELVKKYRAYLFQLFFTEYRGKQERTYPVDQIWALRDDPEKLKSFLRETIAKSLKGEI